MIAAAGVDGDRLHRFVAGYPELIQQWQARMFSRRLGQFWQAPLSNKVVLLEATVFLTFAQVLTKLIPYSWWSHLLGPIGSGEQQVTATHADVAARSVAWGVHTVANHLPWTAVCLPRAMAAKWMLARRKVPSMLVLGIRRSGIGEVKETDIHAWLRVGDQTITGGEAADGFTVIAHYGTL